MSIFPARGEHLFFGANAERTPLTTSHHRISQKRFGAFWNLFFRRNHSQKIPFAILEFDSAAMKLCSFNERSHFNFSELKLLALRSEASSHSPQTCRGSNYPAFLTVGGLQ